MEQKNSRVTELTLEQMNQVVGGQDHSNAIEKHYCTACKKERQFFYNGTQSVCSFCGAPFRVDIY